MELKLIHRGPFVWEKRIRNIFNILINFEFTFLLSNQNSFFVVNLVNYIFFLYIHFLVICFKNQLLNYVKNQFDVVNNQNVWKQLRTIQIYWNKSKSFKKNYFAFIASIRITKDSFWLPFPAGSNLTPRDLYDMEERSCWLDGINIIKHITFLSYPIRISRCPLKKDLSFSSNYKVGSSIKKLYLTWQI